MSNWKQRRRCADSLGFEQLEPRLAMAVIINEFVAKNSNGIRDQDGDRTDWIELRNTGAAAVNLAGWHLTDNAGNLSKWTFPATSIPAGGYMLVYASGKDRSVAGQQLHTNFSLSEDGEYLALVMPDGVTVADAYAPFPPQYADVSYGRGDVSFTSETLINEHAAVRVFVPPNGNLGTTWTNVAFADASWTAGTTGVGYERSPGDVVNFVGLFDLDVNAMMPAAVNNSPGTLYMRIPFTVTDVSAMQTLSLLMKYDDGFIAYINGQEVARANAPAAAAWNSQASAERSDSAATAYATFSISQHVNKLVEGANVLAIHALNRTNSSTNRSDFLNSPMLLADRAFPAGIGFMASPTPGAANSAGTQGFVAPVGVSVERGFFNAPFTVQMTNATAGAQIRYTTDGTLPTSTTGFVYNPASPPNITTTTTLRVAAFKAGFTASNVETRTYIFLNDVVKQNGVGLPYYAPWGNNLTAPIADWEMDPDVVNSPQYSGVIKDALKSVPTVSLVAPWDSWFGPAGVGIYPGPTASELEILTSMEFFTADGSQSYQVHGGIEIQGGTSDDRWKTDKLSMRIKFNANYGPTKFDANIFTDPFDDEPAAIRFDTLILDAQINYTWPYGGSSSPTDQRSRAMYVQDQFVADLQNLAGGKAPHGRFVHLYINGLYWGMYNVHERPDDTFQESYYGGQKEDYDVLKHSATEVVSGDSTAVANYAAMLALVRQDLTVPANYAAAAAKVDVDGLINYMIINYYVGNDDWAHHNWYASYNRVDPNGKWRFHSWDAEHVLKSLSYNAIQTGSFTGSPEEIHLAMMANNDYRVRFSDLAQKLMANGGLLTPQKAAAAYQARLTEVDQAIIGESARWGDNRTTSAEPPGAGNAYTRDHFIARANDLLNNYFPQRTDVVLNQFIARGWILPLAAPVLNNYGGAVPKGFQLTIAAPASGTRYYTLDGSDPRLPGGGLSPAAIAYSGPININAGTQVRVRVFDPGQPGTVNDWSAEIAATYLLETPFPLRITELHYNPAAFGSGDPQNLEFIELMNTSAQSISLNGVQITQFSSTPYAFPNGLTLAPGERIVVAKNPAAFVAAYGPGVRIAPDGYGTQNLSNAGERIALLGPLGETLQDFVYDDENGWPTAADGNGKSLEIINPLGDPSVPANWRASYYIGGSPGTAGLPPLYAGDFDDDNDVDGNDFLLWQRGVGTPALRADAALGDADGDRDVDRADFNLWRGSYGSGASAEPAGHAAAETALAAAVVWDAEQWILADDVFGNVGDDFAKPEIRRRSADAAIDDPISSPTLPLASPAKSRGPQSHLRPLSHHAVDAALAAEGSDVEAVNFVGICPISRPLLRARRS